MKLQTFVALALALSPVLAVAKPAPATPRFRTQSARTQTVSARDRAPKAHVHVTQARQR